MIGVHNEGVKDILGSGAEQAVKVLPEIESLPADNAAGTVAITSSKRIAQS
jgi:hypothetical protein